MIITIKQNEILPNGAKVLDFAIRPDRTIVLAQWEKYLPEEQKEYITWALDEKKNAYWGHYFSDFNEAYDDFKGRI